MIRRYTLPEMGAIWTDEARFEQMLRVEIAVARAQAARGLVPADALAAIEARARVDVERIAEIERTTDHDVIAFVSQVAETVGAGGPLPPPRPDQQRRRRHGARAPAAAPPASCLLDDADALIARARRAGARGGRHADDGPHPLGPRRADHPRPQARRLGVRARPRPAPPGARRSTRSATGKISGPVGTYSHLGPDLEAEVLAELGLHADPVTTQIVQRDRHAAFLAAIAIIGGSLERFATEVRNLQHTEIGELQEPFKAGQKGSSAMPHKRNPILSRADRRPRPAAARLRARGAREPAALARARHQPLVGGAGDPARRDDRSSTTCSCRLTGLVEGLSSGPSGCARTSSAASGLHASSRVLVALVERGGLSREEAYAIVQRGRAPGRRRAAPAAGAARRGSARSPRR